MKFNKYYVLVCALSLLPMLSIFLTFLMPHTHDGLVHLARMAAYFKALKDGEFPVRWAGDLNYGYGMPLFNFIYQFPYWVSSVFLFLGIGLVLSFKFTLALSYILSGIFMFALAKTFFRDDKKALFITLLYQFAPFHLVELLVRGAFGEVYTYAFLPLVLLGISLLFKKTTYKSFFLIVIASSLLIISHNALSLAFFGICVIFTLFFAPNKRFALFAGSGLFLGLLLAAFYWMPALLEHKYTLGDLYMRNLYLEHFPPIQNFFVPNFFNSASLQTGGISVQFGIFHCFALLLALYLLVKGTTEKQVRKVILFSLGIIILSLFFMQPVSKFIWERISLLRQFQFPWRLLGVTSFATALLGVCFFSLKVSKNQFIFWTFCFLITISTLFYWHHPLGYLKLNENYYWNFPLDTTYFGETDVIWTEGPAKSYPKERVSFISGNGTVTNFIKRTTTHTFTVTAQKQSRLVDKTEYFPGWRVYVNGKSVPIEFQDQNWRGQITFAVPQGVSSVKVQFGETPIRLLADVISIVALVLLGIFGLLKTKIFYEKNKK